MVTLVLGPLVRLHGIDENHAGDVGELLVYFRSLQRRLALSVLLVLHTRKNAGDGVAAGQGLRASGDIHAFGDSNLYLRRTTRHLILSSEHRAALASAPAYLKLVANDAATTLLEIIAEPDDENGRGLEEQVLNLPAQGKTLTPTSGQCCRGRYCQDSSRTRWASSSEAFRASMLRVPAEFPSGQNPTRTGCKTSTLANIT
jgi:hypothetical protein